jgi:DNA-binding phage protein
MIVGAFSLMVKPMDLQIKKFRDYIQRVQAETGMTPTEIARRANLAATTITRPMYKPDDANAPSMRTITKIVNAVGISYEAEAESDHQSVRVLAPDAGGQLLPGAIAVQPQTWAYDLPVYQIDAFPPDTIDPKYNCMEVYSMRDEYTEYCRRPPGVAGMPDAYVVTSSAQVLHKYPAGEAMVVAPSRRPKPGDTVLVVMQETPAADRVVMPGVLLARDVDGVTIGQELPHPKQVRLDAGTVSAVHKVLNFSELIGL